MITVPILEKALQEIEAELPEFKISHKSLVKFTDSTEDKRFYGYIDGVNEGYHKAQAMLINKLGLKNVVELGSREGVSTLCIWDSLPKDTLFTTIDIEKDQRYCPDAMFTDPQVKFVFGDVSDLSIFDGAIPMDIDFLFSDTIHYAFQITDEFEIYQHLLADVAIVTVDDIHVNDKGEFFDKVTFKKWDLFPLWHGSGFGMFLYERKKSLTKEERTLLAYQASAKVWKRKHDELEKQLNHLHRKTIQATAKRTIKKIAPLYLGLTALHRYYRSYFLKRGQHV